MNYKLEELLACWKEINYTKNFSLPKFNLPSDTKFYRGRGCNNCMNTGFSGRIMVSELIVLIHGGKISSKAAKDVLAQMVKKDEKPSKIVKNKGLGQISDKSEIQEIVKQVIADHKKPVLDFKQGKQAALQFLVGQIMRVSKGKVNPKIAEEILRKSIV